MRISQENSQDSAAKLEEKPDDQGQRFIVDIRTNASIKEGQRATKVIKKSNKDYYSELEREMLPAAS